MPTTITLTTPDGQPAQVLTVPTSWADVPLATFVALLAPVEGEQRTAAELLLGLDASGLGQLVVDDVQYIANLIEFASDPTPVLELLPTPGLPDVGALPWGCLVLCQEHFREHDERPALASLPYVLAVYRCQLAEGNTDQLDAMLAQVLAAPVTEVYAPAQAFYSACQQSLSGTPRTRATKATPPTKSSTPAARNWLSGLGLRLPWTRSPKAT